MFRDGTLWLQSSYAATWHPTGAIGEAGVVGIAGAHVGDQILSIEGRDVGTFKGSKAVQAVFHSPQPVHLVVRSRSGRVHAVECFNE
jgi:outer membrane lipoprotein SlyB